MRAGLQQEPGPVPLRTAREEDRILEPGLVLDEVPAPRRGLRRVRAGEEERRQSEPGSGYPSPSQTFSDTNVSTSQTSSSPVRASSSRMASAFSRGTAFL